MSRLSSIDGTNGYRTIPADQAARYDEQLAYDIYEVIASVLDFQRNALPDMPEVTVECADVPADPRESSTVSWARESDMNRIDNARSRTTGDLPPHAAHSKKGSFQ